MKSLQEKMEFILSKGFTKCIFCIYGYTCLSGCLDFLDTKPCEEDNYDWIDLEYLNDMYKNWTE